MLLEPNHPSDRMNQTRKNSIKAQATVRRIGNQLGTEGASYANFGDDSNACKRPTGRAGRQTRSCLVGCRPSESWGSAVSSAATPYHFVVCNSTGYSLYYDVHSEMTTLGVLMLDGGILIVLAQNAAFSVRISQITWLISQFMNRADDL